MSSKNPLVPQTVEKEAGHEVSERGDNAKKLYLNFVVMSIYFSANHGSVTSVIALASSFDPTLGSYSRPPRSSSTSSAARGGRSLRVSFCPALRTVRVALTQTFGRAVEWQEFRVLCLGLDGAGKTALVRRCAHAFSAIDDVQPTSGFNSRVVNVDPDVKLEVWELGGAREG